VFIELPVLYHATGYEDDLSYNAQVYVQCPHCSFEERASPVSLLAVDQERLQQSPCPRCEESGRTIVRHREHVTLRCLDCGKTQRVDVAPWEQVRCPNCLSTRLDESDSVIEPTLPSVFGELGERLMLVTGSRPDKMHPWGVDGTEDAGRIMAELSWIADEPDYYRHILMAAMFARSLVTSGDYATEADYNMMLTALGNLERQYFNATGELDAGVDAVAVFEDAVSVAPDDANRAFSEHNVAMAINSLLIKYPEDGVEEATGRPNLREDAIAAASRALSLYEAIAAREPDALFLTSAAPVTAGQEAGLIHHLLGDLLARAPADDDRIRTAIAHYDVAIGVGLPNEILRGVRQARAVALSNLAAPTQEELELAAAELEDLTE
jgi:hypothetical protein